MEIMGDGLKQGSGNTLKKVLEKLTQNVFLGLLTGTLVTAVIQSSTATIVLTVGLVGAGILNLRQAVSIILGANIGTTVTAQIIRLMDIDSSDNSILAFIKPDILAPVALIIGIICVMFVKKESSKNVGMIAMGFGILFMGQEYEAEITEEILTYLERTADQCSNIAMLLLGKNNDEISQNHHLYMLELHASTDQSYLAEQENRRAQYLTPLRELK